MRGDGVRDAGDGGAGEPRYTARLLIACPDRPGIVAAVSGFLFERSANIVSSHQYSSDPSGGRFFMRTEFFLGPGEQRATLAEAFRTQVAERFEMEWSLRWWGERQRDGDPRLAPGPLPAGPALAPAPRRAGDGHRGGRLQPPRPRARRRPRPGSPSTTCPCRRAARRDAEARMLELLAGQAELLVLARYMQILSGAFLERLGMPAINIHHSFLPGLRRRRPLPARARPRREADRGDRALRHRGARRRADHRPGRGARRPPLDRRRARRSSAATSSGSCSRAPWPGTWKTACSSTARRTVVF